jgi:hypothetical protein
VELEDKADLMTKKMEFAAMAIELHAVDGNAALVGFVETSQQM